MVQSGTKKPEGSLGILIVDDDFYGRRYLQRMLSKYGECDIAANGKEAVDAYEKSLKEEFSYDLICLDLMMPVMGGQEALKEIRKLEDERGIYGEECAKIIITTALDDKKNMLCAYSTGCEAYITKPIDKNTLAEKLRELGLVE
jgi:two-component system, chemotaxis family, chemotaxis protein CheY